MKSISLAEIIKATGGVELLPFETLEAGDKTEGERLSNSEDFKISSVETDSRRIKPDSCFIVQKGEKQDGHEYLDKGIELGAKIIVVSDKDKGIDAITAAKKRGKTVRGVLVDDCLKALRDLAGYYLKRENIVVIGVTGSVGKTTTKDIAVSVLKEKFKTGGSIKNFNSYVGVPLSVFNLEDDVQVAVLEMGMDKRYEISGAVSFANPKHAIITNVGFAHMETVGTREDILKAKMEIAERLDSSSILAINGDNDMLKKISVDVPYKIIRAGQGINNDIVVSNIKNLGVDGIVFSLETPHWNDDISMPVPGEHNALNSALVVAVAMEMGLTKDEIIRGLKNVKTTDKRLSVRHKGELLLIDDTYNAAPESTKSAIMTLAATPLKSEYMEIKKEGSNEKLLVKRKRIAILGDMYGQGPTWREMHYDVGTFLAENKIDKLIAVGERGKFIYDGAVSKSVESYFFQDRDSLIEGIDDLIHDGGIILIKASRGMELDRVTEYIMSK